MARGAAQQEKLLNTQASSQVGAAGSLYGDINKRAADLMSGMGTEVNRMLNTVMSPVSAATKAASTRLQNLASKSHNTAGLISGQDQLARTSASEGAKAASDALSTAYDTGLKAESGLYAPTLSAGTNLYDAATRAMLGRTSSFGLRLPGGFGLDTSG